MKKISLLLTILITLSSLAQTPDTMNYFKKGGLASINFSQASFTNWAAGGENSLSGIAILNLFSNYKKDKNTWDNSLDMAYGQLQSGHSALKKNEDKIDFSTKYGRQAFSKNWYYSGLVNFKSQFSNGYNYPNDSIAISHFMAPAYLLIGLGLDYKTKDNSFSIFISPATLKTIFVSDQRLADAGAFGVKGAEYDPNGTKIKNGELVRTELGGYLRLTYKKDIFKNVNLASKLELFNNYLDNPQNIQVNWEVLIGMKINKYLSANISTQMIYDNDIPILVERQVNGVTVAGTGPRLQFKEVLSIAFSYKF